MFEEVAVVTKHMRGDCPDIQFIHVQQHPTIPESVVKYPYNEKFAIAWLAGCGWRLVGVVSYGLQAREWWFSRTANELSRLDEGE